ncbi:MAG: hypothetical protein ACFFFO_14310, partial [Candidatus Thorarchaeota archaeon]
FARKQQEAVKEQWNGDWFKRAWLSDTLGWVGTDIMWLEPQPWTIIGGAADQNQVKVLLKSINEGARRFSKHGAVILSEPLEKMAGKPGIGTNAGVWLSINGTLVWALALIDSDMAWEEWKRNTLSKHAEEYPDVWYGIWSGPDVYNSEFSDKPGETIVVEERGGVSDALEEDQQEEEQGFMGVGWTDFPVMNMHPHAWPVYSAAKLLGIEFTISGVDFSPSLPFETYRFTSPLLELEKSKSGYSGRYSPSASGTWTINIKLSDKEPSRISKLFVNEKKSELVLEEDRLIIRGDSTREEPLIWRVEY